MSVIGDALMQSMAQGLDPNAGITRDYAAKVIEAKDAEIVELKLSTMDKLNDRIAKAKASEAPVSVIDALERLLARVTS